MDKPRFSLNDLLGFMSVPAEITKGAKKGAEKVGSFVNDQMWGPEAQAYFQQALHPKQDFSHAAHHSGYARMGDIGGITDNPMALKIMNVLGNLTNAATHSGVGKWFGADAAQNIAGGPTGKHEGNLGDIANVVFSLAPLGVGGSKAAKKAASGTSKEVLGMVNLLRGMLNPSNS